MISLFRKWRRDRERAKAISERLDRQQPEVTKLSRELRALRNANRFREDFGKTLRGEM